MSSSTVPHGIPTLAPGRHRTPRRGANLMEVASLLAGEPWSDRPACTHPLLGELARLVNDHTSDAGRQELMVLAPDLVGRHGDDDTWLRIPVAIAAPTILDLPETAQHPLAAGLLRAERLCAAEGPRLAETARQARAALDLVPGAVAWAERHGAPEAAGLDTFAQYAAPAMVRCTVGGIVAADGDDRDRRLRDLLEAGIATCPQEQVARGSTWRPDL